MKTTANNFNTGINKTLYKATKCNKYDTIYQKVHSVPEDTIYPAAVKIEVFQGFSKAVGIDFYFRIKNARTWDDSEQVTGLGKTATPGIYYGNQKENEKRTLLLFRFTPDRHRMIVYQFMDGYNPNRQTIEKIAQQIAGK